MARRFRTLSRRKALKAAAAAAGGAAILGAGPALAQAPGILTNRNAGRRFRAFVRHGTTAGVEELRLRPIEPRQVLVRTEATAPCYTIVAAALATTPARQAEVPNHCGFGIVEEVGPLVKRVQKGDRVVVAGTSQCGQCFQCLHGNPDYCQYTFGGEVWSPFADMADGTPVFAQGGIGGLGELMVTLEDFCCPVFTDLPAAELTLLGDQLTSGFSAGHSAMRFEPGSNVVVFGAGPVGVGVMQAGRVLGAGQVIVIDPVQYRRDFALKMGATTVLDPAREPATLVERIRELCKAPTDRKMAGGQSYAKQGNAAVARGADFAVEAAGVQTMPPKVEPSPDPTGVTPVKQAWECTRMGGHVMLMGLVRGEVSFPGVALALLGRTIHPGQQGGLHMMRDLPRMVTLMEKGRIDARSMITKTYTIDETRQALQDCADRTVITGVIRYT
jgi:S-(hydroxymethyl)glutathione dehydrogenase/alcohol dehydrogenase